MIPVCTERDSTCAKRQKFSNQIQDVPKQIVFHADDYFKKRKRKKKRKKKIKKQTKTRYILKSTFFYILNELFAKTHCQISNPKPHATLSAYD